MKWKWSKDSLYNAYLLKRFCRKTRDRYGKRRLATGECRSLKVRNIARATGEGGRKTRGDMIVKAFVFTVPEHRAGGRVARIEGAC